ncbi:MAG: HEAT repeat domain-containing protein [bacterium]|nr:HEAT repeat domain-containing protein [bacterium]
MEEDQDQTYSCSDIMCLNTGFRFESRGKTKPEISMSHSLNDPRRAWNAGMQDDDYVLIVVFKQGVDSPVDLKRISPVHFISVKDLRGAFADKRVSITKPKGVEEGSEIRVIWPSAVANEEAIVSEVSPRRISLAPLSGAKRQIVQLSRSKGAITLVPQVRLNDKVEKNQIVAAVVPVRLALTRTANIDEAVLVEKLRSIDLSERYAAAKALRYRGYLIAQAALEERISHAQEDIYVQLEAAAALAAHDHLSGWAFIEAKLCSSVLDVPLETQLETVIVISEIPDEKSERLLIAVLRDEHRDEELRAGAAWALGQFATATAATALVDTFNSTALDIKTEAARALLKIAQPQVAHLVEMLKTSDPSKRDGISWALARTGKFNLADILPDADDNLRKWLGYIMGYGKKNLNETDVDAVCQADPEVYFAASVLWQILASWVDDLTEY